MQRLFGTDGVRGLANKFITADLALKLGRSAGRILGDSNSASHKRAIVGRDTRISGEFLSSAICAGLASTGIDVINVGIIPTPAVAYLSQNLGVDLGVVISASHNPMEDNGIKFFASNGFKLPDEVEDKITQLLDEPYNAPLGNGVGHIQEDFHNATNDYVQHLINCVSSLADPQPLFGIKVAVDPANGSASYTAPEALRKLGAQVYVINDSPDGSNINLNSGSTHPEQLQAMTLAAKCDLGVAFDGDADRVIAVDEKGAIVDGDKIMGIIAKDLHSKKQLTNNTVVATIMSNLGFINALSDLGIRVLQTSVGDRYVTEKMREGGYSFGGEQSGHIINSNYSTSGDGTLTALMLISILAHAKKPLSEFAAEFPKLPQVLINVPNVKKEEADSNLEINNAISEIREQMADPSRVLLRASGTEPLVRVMVEAPTEQEAEFAAKTLAEVVAKHIPL